VGCSAARVAHGARYARLARFRAERAKLDGGCVLEEEQIRCYQQRRELAERRNMRFGLVGTFVATAILFGLSMLRVVDASSLTTLLAVVVFHELGHYGAMVALGYRDTSIFCIPFFGAAARGIKRDASLHEQLIVLLAGPLPGLLLAGGVAVFAPNVAQHPIGREAVVMLIAVNMLNLLPIYPLDGGRMVELLFSGTRPFVEVSFRAFGALLLLALGVFAQEVVMLALAGVVAASIPATRRAANAVRRIRALGPLPKEEDGKLKLVLSELRANQPSLAPQKRFAVITPVAKRLQDGELTRWSALGWSGTYIFSVIAGCAVLVTTITSGPKQTRLRERTVALACGGVEASSQQVETGPGMIIVTCALPQGRDAPRELEKFIRLPSATCLKAPWLPRFALTTPEQHARSTLFALADAADEATASIPPPDLDGLSDEASLRPEAEAYFRESARLAASAHASFVQAHQHDSDFHAEAAALYMKLPEARGPELSGARALANLLGRVSDTCDPNEAEYTHVHSNEREAVVSGQRSDRREGVAQLASHLCQRGCSPSYRALQR
jgi:Zn-dependent protease